MDKQIIALGAKQELARRSLWWYCKLKDPKFYSNDKAYLNELCDQMQQFTESEDDVLVVNLPPRHGKSYTATNLVAWLFGRDKNNKIMTGSYNEDLSTDFSTQVRDTISKTADWDKKDPGEFYYSDVFPNTRVKRGSAKAKKWELVGGFKNYLATSPNGSATGMGCTYLIIDDLIKNSYEAHNDPSLEKQWNWFVNTMLSRLETGGKVIIIMTRWSEKDLAGRALKELPQLGYKIKHISMKALQDDGSMLCESVLSRREYDLKTGAMSKDIAEANYNQNCINLEGRLYQNFLEYDELPEISTVKCYIDTADKGSDYLCSIIYGPYMKKPYVMDVLYTQKPMSYTDEETAKRIVANKVRECLIEGNNGGEGFARSVERICRDKYKYTLCRFKTFHQSKNKEARILSNSTWIEDNILFPKGWGAMWPEYYDAMYSYQREGKNEHDDAPDATTGVAEQFTEQRKVTIGSKKILGL